jgi:hypothetical protein
MAGSKIAPQGEWWKLGGWKSHKYNFTSTWRDITSYKQADGRTLTGKENN